MYKKLVNYLFLNKKFTKKSSDNIRFILMEVYNKDYNTRLEWLEKKVEAFVNPVSLKNNIGLIDHITYKKITNNQNKINYLENELINYKEIINKQSLFIDELKNEINSISNNILLFQKQLNEKQLNEKQLNEYEEVTTVIPPMDGVSQVSMINRIGLIDYESYQKILSNESDISDIQAKLNLSVVYNNSNQTIDGDLKVVGDIISKNSLFVMEGKSLPIYDHKKHNNKFYNESLNNKLYIGFNSKWNEIILERKHKLDYIGEKLFR